MRKQTDLDAALAVAEVAHRLSDLHESLRARGFSDLADACQRAEREFRSPGVSHILNEAGVPFNAARP